MNMSTLAMIADLSSESVSVKEKKKIKAILYDLGWFEDEKYHWRCNKCYDEVNQVDCNLCGQCEWCHPCQ
jgi:hypothetical protein